MARALKITKPTDDVPPVGQSFIMWKKVAAYPVGAPRPPSFSIYSGKTVILKLEVPADALRVFGGREGGKGRGGNGQLKVRASKVKVLSAHSVSNYAKLSAAYLKKYQLLADWTMYQSDYKPFEYKVGEVAMSVGKNGQPKFTKNVHDDCGSGIHGFPTKERARKWNV